MTLVDDRPAETPPEVFAPSVAPRAAAKAPRLLVVAALVIAIGYLAPTLYLVWQNQGLDTDVLGTLFSEQTLGPLWRTVSLAVVVSATSAVIGTGLAWCTTRSDVPGRRVWAVLAPLPLVIPSFVGAAALQAGVAPGGLVAGLLEPVGLTPPEITGFVGAWLVLSLFTYPYVYLPVAARLSSLPPSLEESARLLGHSPRQVFRTVVLPQTATSIWAGALLVFLYVVSDFGAVELMRYGTLTREIFQAKLAPTVWLPLALVLAVLALTVVAGERAIGRRRTRTDAVRARSALHVPLGRWRWPTFAALVVVLGNALVGPLAVLAWWAVRGILATRSSGTLAVDPAALIGPTITTIALGLTAAVVTVVVVLPVAWLTGRYRSRTGGAANAMVVGGFALPGLVVALSLVFWVLQTPGLRALYQTYIVLIVAYALHFGAQATRAGQVAVSSVPARLDDAARMLGAGRVRRLRTIDLPLMRPGLVAGGGLVLLSTMKELPATLVLAPPDTKTLATTIWSSNESLALAQMGLASLVLVTVSGVLTWAFVIRRA